MITPSTPEPPAPAPVRVQPVVMPHRTSKGFLSTYRKGRSAAKAGQERKPPYEDKMGGRFQHVITWSRSFRKYWLEGFDDEKQNQPDRYAA